MDLLRRIDVPVRRGFRVPVFLIAVILIGLVTCAWLIFSPAAKELEALRDEVAGLQRENRQIWWGNVRMERELRALRESPAMIERQARRQLAYGRPGEEAFEPLPADAVDLPSRGFKRRPLTFLARAGAVVRAYWANGLMALLGLAALVVFMSDWRIEQTDNEKRRTDNEIQ